MTVLRVAAEVLPVPLLVVGIIAWRDRETRRFGAWCWAAACVAEIARFGLRLPGLWSVAAVVFWSASLVVFARWLRDDRRRWKAARSEPGRVP